MIIRQCYAYAKKYLSGFYSTNTGVSLCNNYIVEVVDVAAEVDHFGAEDALPLEWEERGLVDQGVGGDVAVAADVLNDGVEVLFLGGVEGGGG